MDKIYYVIRPKFSTIHRYVNEGDFDTVYNRIMTITNGNHDKAANAQGWCELASVGEIFEDDEFEIEIISEDD